MVKSQLTTRIAAAGLWTAFMALTLLAALFLVWQLLARADYGYPLWYEVIGIDQTIARYGPRNRYREDFETTTKAERVRLFAELAAAVRHHGEGLEALTYHDPSGKAIAPLLTAPEIQHLRDVARLFAGLWMVGWVALAGWLALVGALRWRGYRLPALKQLLLGTVLGSVLVALVVTALGPVRVFYRLHTWIFPPDHPWFFYYEDSLMTMMMQAPVIFGWIALAWAALAVGFAAGLLVVARRVCRGSGH
ncbi:MAG: DUF1461 domain-containing protein [Gammaproteobacteria bacterium]